MRAPRALAAVGAAFFAQHVFATPGLFDVDFDANPAPVAEHALRDKAYLPAQICGIIGAYIFSVLVVGIALLTYGRKMRRAVTDQRVDVVKANGTNGFEMTPVSPSSRWRSPLSPSKLKHAFKKSQTSIAERQQQSVPTSPISPSCQSMSSFDQNFLKNQQEERQKEMERLYAAVMEHDEERKKKVANSSAEEIQESPEEEEDEERHYPVQPKGRPPMINTAASLRVPSSQNPASPISPASPRSPVRAIYPPESPMAAARRQNYASPPPSSPRGILSKKDRTASIGSTGSKSRRSIRNLRISGPITKYPGQRDDEEARTPLSPRFYNPGPPPSPPSATTAPTPTTPNTAESFGPFHYEDLGRPHPLPRAHPQRSESGRTLDAHSMHSSHTPRPSNGSNTIDIAMRAGDAPSGPPPAIRTQDLPPPPRGLHASARSATSSTSELPLRSMAPDSAQSPSTKTTVIEARNRGRDLLSPTNRGMRTPATGVPMTPYSPYMPYTPITPVTPHLVTRKERKQRQRDERKMGLRSPLQEGDEVGDVDWGDAY